MLKYLGAIMLTALCTLSSNAQICKISDMNDTVEVLGAYLDSNKQSAVVTVSNDSQYISANINVTVEVCYKYRSFTETKQFVGRNLATPQQTTTIIIPIDASGSKEWFLPVSVKVTAISGAKCRE